MARFDSQRVDLRNHVNLPGNRDINTAYFLVDVQGYSATYIYVHIYAYYTYII